jgi:TolB-like protein/thioredoxin-like negative regulator of GroEL
VNVLGELKRRNVFRMAGLYLVSAWLVVQVGATLLPVFDAPRWVMKALVGTLAIGFPIALVVAWVFAWTPAGFAREAEVPPAQSVAPHTARWLDRSIIVVLLLAVSYFALDKFVLAPGRADAASAANAQNDRGLVAVLPFRNRGTGTDDAAFIEGIHDDLLTQLSKVAGLKVVSRTSMMRYADSRLSVPEIARELGAAVVLEGAVQRAGDQVRINVQLIDGARDVQLWGEAYDRALTTETIFAIQADVAHAIASAMKVVLTPAEADALAAGSTANLKAYEAFVQGKLLAVLDKATPDRLAAALRQYDRAIELDPSFADAYARKTRTQLTTYWYGYGDASFRKAAATTLDHARRLAPDATETWMAEAYMRYWGERDYVGAEAILARVLERSPDHAEAWYARALVARRDGRFEDSIQALTRSLAIDPVNTDTMLELGNTLATLGRYDEAVVLFDRSVELGAAEQYHDAEHELARGDVDAAGAAVEGPNEVFESLPFRVAVASRDPQRIEFALSPALWPERLRSQPDYPETYPLAKAEGLLVMGRTQEAQTLLREIRARVDARDPRYPAGWASSGAYYYFPSQLPGLMGDLEGVQAAELDFLENAPKDAWAELSIRLALAGAFARAGDPGRALHHLETMAKLTGPGSFPSYDASPDLDPLRAHPRYLALKKGFEEWAEARRISTAAAVTAAY